MIDMKKDKFTAKEAVCMLLANKLLGDYLNETSEDKSVEIEHFAEEWFSENLTKKSQAMTKTIWRAFLDSLLDYREDTK